MHNLIRAAAAATLAVAGLAAPAIAEYPEKPVNFIVPWPPGDLGSGPINRIPNRSEM